MAWTNQMALVLEIIRTKERVASPYILINHLSLESYFFI